MSKECQTCRFWSDLMARTNELSGGLEAMCLSAESQFRQQYTMPHQYCGHAYRPETRGAVDMRGPASLAAYAAEAKTA